MSESTEHPFDGKELYTVEIERRETVVVLAEDEDDALKMAAELVKDTFTLSWDDTTYDAEVIDVTEPYYIPAGWIKTEPYGGKRGATCEQMIELLKHYHATRPATQAELEAAGQMRLRGSDSIHN